MQPLTFSEFIVTNVWYVLVALASIGFASGTVYLTIISTMKHVVDDVAAIHKKVSSHEGRIASLEVAQARRLGYEEAMAEMKRGDAA